MGLANYMVDALVREHVYKPIAGDVLLIGRQTVYMSPEEVLDLLRSHGVVPAIAGSDIELDRDTLNRRKGQRDDGLISDASLFALLGNRQVKALDHTSYEGAEVVHDLGKEIPAHLKASADLIIDGSTLDNTFNPALTLKNYAELLRPGGRLLAVNQFSNHFDPYVIISPVWYLDYFVANAFADCKVYLVVHMDRERNTFCIDRGRLLEPRPEFTNAVGPFEMATVVIAEKGTASTSSKRPVRDQWRSESEWADYRKNLAAMNGSARPLLLNSRTDTPFFDPGEGYLFIDDSYVAQERMTEKKLAPPTEATPKALKVVERTKHFVPWLAGKLGYEIVKRQPQRSPPPRPPS